MTELPISRSGVGGFFFPRLIGAADSTGAAWALPGFRPDLKTETFFQPFILYSCRICEKS